MISDSLTLKDAVSTDQFYQIVMERFEIDPPELKRQIGELSNSGNLDISFLIEVLIAFENIKEASAERFMEFPMQIVLNYLKRTHEYYTSRRLLEIEQTIFNLERKFAGSQHAVVFRLLRNYFDAYQHDLLEHIEMEEKGLFPYVAFLDYADRNQGDLESWYRQHGVFSIDHFTMLHQDEVESRLLALQQHLLQLDASLPGNLSFRIFNTQLETFRKDLEVHAFIEDYVLVPKARQIEQKLLAAS